MSTVIYGASDDLIDVRGDIDEEFSAYLDVEDERFLAISNGVVLRVTYDNEGVWRIVPIAGASKVCIVFARGEEHGSDDDGCPGYSDKAVLAEPVEWVVFGREWAKR